MTLSLYQASAPVFTHALGNLSRILDKAAAHAAQTGLDPKTLIDARLAPDMFPLNRQVQTACDTAKLCCARLSGATAPVHADTETTFDQLQTRITETLAFIASVAPEQIDGQEARPVTLKLPGTEMVFTGQSYLLTFALPNFFFHITTAYDILRSQGVALGKKDFLGTL